MIKSKVFLVPIYFDNSHIASASEPLTC